MPEEPTEIVVEGETVLDDYCPNYWCQSDNVIYREDLDLYQCLDCGEVWQVE